MQISRDRLLELERRFRVDLTRDELDEVTEAVNEHLADADEVYELGSGDDGGVRGTRTWRDPDDDPHNAITVDCQVQMVGASGGIIDGTTVGVKDIIAVAGIPMECGSAAMRGFVPPRDATVITRLLKEGATITAKTNLDEFAVGSRGRSSHGQIVNPHDPEHSPGGSSGGSAVAVATNRVDIALGTDMGGSVRIPAAYCGVVGLKPTHGLVPRAGVFENSQFLDHVGPITTTLTDAGRALEATAGPDERDPATFRAANHPKYRIGGYAKSATTTPEPSALEFGVIEEGMGRGTADGCISERMVDRTERVIDQLDDAGASIRRVSIERFEKSRILKELISGVERAASWRAGGTPYSRGDMVDERSRYAMATRLAGRSAELTPQHKARILAGAHLIEDHQGRHYARALAAACTLRSDFEETVADLDALLLPTTPSIAPKIESTRREFRSSRNTHPANVAQLPALTLPNGTINGLPAGLQLIGPSFGEGQLLRAGRGVEAVVSE